jgi:hypothetical protein
MELLDSGIELRRYAYNLLKINIEGLRKARINHLLRLKGDHQNK